MPGSGPAAATTRLGAGLLRRLPAERNATLSPFGVACALSLAAEGARGEARAAFARALGSPSAPAATWGALAADLEARHPGPAAGAEPARAAPEDAASPWQAADGESTAPPALRVSSAAFLRRGIAVEPAYLRAVRGGGRAAIAEVDFARDREGAAALVNRWAHDATRGRIAEVVDAASLDPDTRVLLCNALWFKASWPAPFPPPHGAPFTLPDGSRVEVETLAGECGSACLDDDEATAVRLDYAGGDASLVLVLPRRDGGAALAALEEGVDADRLRALALDGARSEAEFRFPQFRARARADLSGALAGLGLSPAFDANADYSGMAPRGEVALGAVVHAAVVEVDRFGTEAAAFTQVEALSIDARPAPPVVRFDRPFLFAILDRRTGMPIFLGRVTDPRG